MPRLIKGSPEAKDFMNRLRNLRKGGSQRSGYVQRLERENKIILSKITNPSDWMLAKYGQQVQPVPQQDVPQEQPIFDPTEAVEFNVGKPKTKKVKNNQPTEAQIEAQEKHAREQLAQKQKFIDSLTALKKKIVEYKKKVGQETSLYHDNLDNLQPGKWNQTKKELEKTGRKNLTKDSVREHDHAKTSV